MKVIAFGIALVLLSCLSSAQEEQCRTHTAPRWVFDAACCSGNGTATTDSGPCLVGEGPCDADVQCAGALRCGAPGRCPAGFGFTVDARCCFDTAVGESNPDTRDLTPVMSAEGIVLLPLSHGPSLMSSADGGLRESPDTRRRNIDLDQTGLNVAIEAGPDGTGYDVSATGTVYNVITADEAETWGIGSTYDLMNAIQAHFGKKPNEAWLSSPAGSNELYDTYGWEQVKTRLTALSAEVVEIYSQPEVLAEKVFENHSNTLVATFDASIREEVRKVASNTWTTERTLGFKQTINYGIGFLVGGSGSTELSFSNTVGEEHTETVWNTVGSDSGSSMVLGPGQGARVELSSTKGTMTVRVKFHATIEGCIAMDYSSGWQGHHFWCLSASNVLSAYGKPTTIELEQLVEIGYFHTSVIRVVDHLTGVQMASFPMADTPITLVEVTTAQETTTAAATTTTIASSAAGTTTTAAATTTATQPTATSGTCTVRAGTDLAAGTATNIDALPQGIGASSAGECCEICSSYDQCIAGVFNTETGDWCWLVKSFNGFESHGGRTVVERQAPPPSDACNGARADASCCSAGSPCALHEGDCDDDSQCEGDLVCGVDNCNAIGLGFPDSTWDCCVPSASSCSAYSTTDLAAGTASNTDLLPNGVAVASAWDCCDVCAADPQCIAGVFNTDPENPWCWAVKSYSGMVYHGERMVLVKE